MTATRYDGADWPATITVGEGWYGLRIDTDHGTAVEYVDAHALNPMRQEPDEGTRSFSGSSAAERPAVPARRRFDPFPESQRAGPRGSAVRGGGVTDKPSWILIVHPREVEQRTEQYAGDARCIGDCNVGRGQFYAFARDETRDFDDGPLRGYRYSYAGRFNEPLGSPEAVR